MHGPVTGSDIANLLRRLRDPGIEPDQAVTDGSSLYPESLAEVWPKAVHQMCLFHQTRIVVKTASKVIRKLIRTIPREPAKRGGKFGRLRLQHDPGGAGPRDRAIRIALVPALRKEGYRIRRIAQMTGHSLNTIRSWVRSTVRLPAQLSAISAEPLEAVKEGHGHLRADASEPEAPPAPWRDWAEGQRTRRRLKRLRFKLLSRPE